jgi:hypothetical protein
MPGNKSNNEQKQNKGDNEMTTVDIGAFAIAVVAAAIIGSAIGAFVVAWMFSPEGGAE